VSFQPGDTTSSRPAGSAIDPRIGTTVGVYRLESLLGAGGYGRVYRAFGPDGTQVALKLVKRQFALDDTFRLRFAREAEIARTIVDPHLVPVLDSGEHEGVPYMAQRFIESGSLEDKLGREKTLAPDEITRLAEQVASGLDALATAGVFHRDIKPGNILLDRAGDAYVTDFGLAKDTQGADLTAPGQTLGSMDYMAPEQIRGHALSAAVDIYALGCVVFECLSGQPPFAHRKGMDVLWAHLRDEPADPATGRDDVSYEFARAALTALAKDPSERPPSAGAYGKALRDAAAH
jgi:serine/threonine-protein kinase